MDYSAEGSAAEELPVLGEPLAVEFANSLYEGDDETVDFLATPERVARWLRCAPAAKAMHVPARLTRENLNQLGELRRAVRTLLIGAASGAALSASAARTLNRFAAVAPSFARLEPDAEGRFVAVTAPSSSSVEGLFGRLAHEAIVLIGGAHGARIRRCGAAGCPMLFVQNHHRRKWCHESCGHRSRQAAYYRRNVAAFRRTAE